MFWAGLILIGVGLFLRGDKKQATASSTLLIVGGVLIGFEVLLSAIMFVFLFTHQGCLG